MVRSLLRRLAILTTAWLAAWFIVAGNPANAEEPAKEPPAAAMPLMPVDQLREGQEGIGKTVLRGVELTEFKVKILGVLRGFQPGRDMVLAKLSGANLEFTGVIAGMSGSPVYIDGKLVGAVAYTWSFNKEPICGITPIQQMQAFAERPVDQTAFLSLTTDGAVTASELMLGGDPCAGLALAPGRATAAAAGQTEPLKAISVPLVARGFAPIALHQLHSQLSPLGVTAVAAGGAGAGDVPDGAAAKIVPGGVLGASLVTGDLDLSGLGTVTHVEGDRVWGWGHPFLAAGKCHYLLRPGYVHLVNAKNDLSTKMGSPLETVGVLQADVSTCIAGRLGGQADLLPVRVTIGQQGGGPEQTVNVEIVRHPLLVGTLITSVLNSVLEGHGAVAQEVTIDLEAVIRTAGLEPITIQDRFSGPSVSGNQGAQQLLGRVALIADRLTRNPFQPARLDGVECKITLSGQRRSASIVTARLSRATYEPGQELKAIVTLSPWRGAMQDVEIAMTLPESLPPGNYQAMVCDAATHVRQVLVEQPQRLDARDVASLAEVFRIQTAEKQHMLFLRVVSPESGLMLGEAALPQLPASVQASLVGGRSGAARPIRHVLHTRKPMDWSLDGSANLRFTVVADRQVTK